MPWSSSALNLIVPMTRALNISGLSVLKILSLGLVRVGIGILLVRRRGVRSLDVADLPAPLHSSCREPIESLREARSPCPAGPRYRSARGRGCPAVPDSPAVPPARAAAGRTLRPE